MQLALLLLKYLGVRIIYNFAIYCQKRAVVSLSSCHNHLVCRVAVEPF